MLSMCAVNKYVFNSFTAQQQLLNISLHRQWEMSTLIVKLEPLCISYSWKWILLYN